MSQRRPSVSARCVLPLEARQAAWDALWRRLLEPIPDEDDPDPENDDEERPDEAA
jgi:hypothetical protein